MHPIEKLALQKKLSRIEIIGKKLADQIHLGKYRSVFYGNGIEFEDVRPFVDGDSERHLSANVTARMNAPYVKLFREERRKDLIFAIDCSSSMSFGSQGETKKEIAQEIFAALALLSIKNFDYVSAYLFGSKVTHFPKGKQKEHILAILSAHERNKKSLVPTQFEPLLKAILHREKKRCSLFLLSDFFGNLPLQLLQILAKKHDVFAVFIHDPLELFPPPIQNLLVKDLESGKQGLLEKGGEPLRKHLTTCKKLLIKEGISIIETTTDTSPITALVRFFQKRKQSR